MRRRSDELKLYTVVEVCRGVAASAKNFQRLRNAQKYMRRLSRGLDWGQDDVQLFECPIRLSVHKSFTRS